MWNDLYKEAPTCVEITCMRHSFENTLLIWKIIWLCNCGIREVRAGGSVKEQLKGASIDGEWEGCEGGGREACQRPPPSNRRWWMRAVTLRKEKPSSQPDALKPEKSDHHTSLDPADSKRFLQWTLEGTMHPQPFIRFLKSQ